MLWRWWEQQVDYCRSLNYAYFTRPLFLPLWVWFLNAHRPPSTSPRHTSCSLPLQLLTSKDDDDDDDDGGGGGDGAVVVMVLIVIQVKVNVSSILFHVFFSHSVPRWPLKSLPWRLFRDTVTGLDSGLWMWLIRSYFRRMTALSHQHWVLVIHEILRHDLLINQ